MIVLVYFLALRTSTNLSRKNSVKENEVISESL